MDTQPPSNIVGPIDRNDWLLLIALKRSIQHLSNKNKEKYGRAIQEDLEHFESTLEKYLTPKAA